MKNENFWKEIYAAGTRASQQLHTAGSLPVFSGPCRIVFSFLLVLLLLFRKQARGLNGDWLEWNWFDGAEVCWNLLLTELSVWFWWFTGEDTVIIRCVATLLGTPAQSDAIQYNRPIKKCPFMVPLMFRLMFNTSFNYDLFNTLQVSFLAKAGQKVESHICYCMRNSSTWLCNS